MPLPTDNSWIEHLEILDTIRINSMGHFLSLEEFYSKVLEGYTLAGIRKDSVSFYFNNWASELNVRRTSLFSCSSLNT